MASDPIHEFSWPKKAKICLVNGLVIDRNDNGIVFWDATKLEYKTVQEYIFSRGDVLIGLPNLIAREGGRLTMLMYPSEFCSELLKFVHPQILTSSIVEIIKFNN